MAPCTATVESNLQYVKAIKHSTSATCCLWTLPKYYADLQQICRALYVDLRNLRDPTQMLINLLKTRRPASALHFHLTFQRAGSVLPRLALASLHPHGSSSCSLTFSLFKGLQLGWEIGDFHTRSLRCQHTEKRVLLIFPLLPHTHPLSALLFAPAMFLFPMLKFSWPHLFLFLWNLSITRMPRRHLPHGSCSRKSASFVAALCKFASLDKYT